MKTLIIILFLFTSNIVYSQPIKDMRNIFELQCWENTLKQLDSASVILAFKNAFVNSQERSWARQLMVVYYRNDSFQWFYKVILIDLKKRKWHESESENVSIFFEQYLNKNTDKLKSNLKEICEGPREEASWGWPLAFYYKDSTNNFINNYYSSSYSSGINILLDNYPLVFNMYSFAINMSYNIKFKYRFKIKEKYYPLIKPD